MPARNRVSSVDLRVGVEGGSEAGHGYGLGELPLEDASEHMDVVDTMSMYLVAYGESRLGP